MGKYAMHGDRVRSRLMWLKRICSSNVCVCVCILNCSNTDVLVAAHAWIYEGELDRKALQNVMTKNPVLPCALKKSGVETIFTPKCGYYSTDMDDLKS